MSYNEDCVDENYVLPYSVYWDDMSKPTVKEFMDAVIFLNEKYQKHADKVKIVFSYKELKFQEVN